MITELFRHKAVIICGHFGTGKTNISVNLALDAAESGKSVYIADLDTVNPYFRTADNADMLKKAGVSVLLPQFANTNVDIPALPQSFQLIFNEDKFSVTDVGGNEEGASVLRGFAQNYREIGYDMYYVFNSYRPENTDTEISLASFKAIEAASGLNFTGIINNSNLGAETTKDIVKNSFSEAADFARAAGVEMIMTTAFAQNACGNCTVIRDITKKLF